MKALIAFHNAFSRRGNFGVRRWLSIEHRPNRVATFENQVGGLLEAKVTGNATVKVFPSLLEDTRIHVFDEHDAQEWKVEQKGDKYVALNTARCRPGHVLIEVFVPNHSNIKIHAESSDVSIPEYIEGDVEVFAGGDVGLRKVRGNLVAVHSGGGSISIKEKIEASNLQLTALKGSIVAQKLLAHSMKLQVVDGQLKFASGFVDEGEADVRNGVIDINGYHGKLTLKQTGDPHPVQIRGVNGQLDANLIGHRSTVVQFDSLFKGTASVVHCATGSTTISIPTDQSIELVAKAKGSISLPNIEKEAETNDPYLRKVTVKGSPELSRADRTSGKINIAESFKKDHLWGAMKSAKDLENAMENGNIHSLPPNTSSLHITCAESGGNIEVETVGWRDRIRRRFLD